MRVVCKDSGIDPPCSDSAQLQESFEQIYEQYFKSVCNFLFRLSGQRDLFEDLAQETFLAAYRNISQFNASGSMKSWLYTIAINKLRDHLRKEGRRIITVDSPMRETAAENGCPHSALLQKEMVESIRRAVLALPEPLREPLVLVRFEGMTYEQVADTLGITLAAARMRIHRAVLQLAAVLKKSEWTQEHTVG